MQYHHELRRVIIERFSTQLRFAFAAKVDPTYVTHIIRGYRKLPPERATEWANLLDCNPWLLHQVTDPEEEKGGES